MKPWRSVVILLGLAGLLAGCASGEPLAHAHGPIFALNTGLWHPTPAELHALPRVPHS
ncbi:MAG: type IV secretion system lipoprotein VirB7 [Acidiphilium sp.]|jgi:hydrogenase/urease accessory protein HupE|nr:type IV secretion system lipoprotein VirB7 [Acidiphilium sp.]